jgi:hypothetical protein
MALHGLWLISISPKHFAFVSDYCIYIRLFEISVLPQAMKEHFNNSCAPCCDQTLTKAKYMKCASINIHKNVAKMK